MSYVKWILPILVLGVGCGRSPSSIVRRGQLPVTDFPLYATVAPGDVWRFDANANITVFASGLSNPKGIAVDAFGRVYVAEQGNNRLLRFKPDGTMSVYRSGLAQPEFVAIDSFNQVYVSQVTPKNIIRAEDGQVLQTYSQVPTAVAFGVGDLIIVVLDALNQARWGSATDAPTATVTEPSYTSVDQSGRVYVSEPGTPLAGDGRVLRYDQKTPGDPTVVVNGLESPMGIAGHPAQNIFVAAQGDFQIVLATHSGTLHTWAAAVPNPRYLAFTRY